MNAKGVEHPILAGQSDGRDRGVRLLQLLTDHLGALERPQTHEVLRVLELHLVVVNPEVDRFGRLAAQDDLVVPGSLQLGTEEPAHHREPEEPGLRGDGGHDGAIASGSGGPHQQTGAEDKEVFRIEVADLRGNPVPEQLGVRAQSSEMELGEPRVRRHPFDVPPGQIDLQIEPGFRVSHSSPPSVSLEAEAT
jgi:hypothetical protein